MKSKKLAAPVESKSAAMESAVILLENALRLCVNRLEDFGLWDDGCFYFNGTSAPELEDPIKRGVEALAALDKAQKLKHKGAAKS